MIGYREQHVNHRMVPGLLLAVLLFFVISSRFCARPREAFLESTKLDAQ